MTTVTIMPEGKTVDASEGQSLFSLIKGAEPEDHKCDDACHLFSCWKAAKASPEWARRRMTGWT